MMKKRNGFTLIELLAIIVILAIIAVITVPIILNIIENSRRGAASDSAYGYKDAVNKWYISKLQEDNGYTLSGNYTVSDGKLNNIDIPLSGDKPANGTLTYSNNVLIGGCLTIGEYKITFDSKGSISDTVKGECESAPGNTILYYTYDENGTESINGKITQKLSEPNSNWALYIQETSEQATAENDLYALQYSGYETEFVFTQQKCNELIYDSNKQSCVKKYNSGDTYKKIISNKICYDNHCYGPGDTLPTDNITIGGSDRLDGGVWPIDYSFVTIGKNNTECKIYQYRDATCEYWDGK